MEIESREKRRDFGLYWKLAAGAAVFAALFVISRDNYLLFHGIAEIFSSLVALTIFVLAWHTRKFTENDYLLFLGVAYLFVGMLDLVHMLAYSGMGVFEGYGTNLATQLWIAARYIEAFSLLLAPLFLARRLRERLDIALYAAVTVLVLISIFYLDIFPACFVEGSGLTPFKRISEYVICLILIASIAMLVRKREEFDPRVFRLVVASISITIASELCFTLYQDPYAFFNLLGHFLKILSFYLIYLAIVDTGLEEPYRLLFRKLNEREKRERAILDATADSLVLLDKDSRVLAINDVAARAMGRSAEELVGATLDGFISSDLYRRIEAAIVEVLGENASVRKEEEYEGRWYEYTVYPVLDEKGEAGMLAVYSRDITERKSGERALIESKERWRRSFDAIGDAMLLVDKDMNILQHNDAFSELLGRKGEDLAGRKCYELVHGLEGPPDFCICVEAMACKGRARNEVYEPSLDKHLWISLSPVFDGRGEMEFAVHVIQDISERRRMEEDLRESEEKFRSMVEQSPDGIVMVDSRGRVIEWNSAQEGIVGLLREEVLGEYLWDVQYRLILPEQKTPRAYEKLRGSVLDLLGRGYASWFGETSERELMVPDGGRRIVQTVSFPIRSREGMMVGSITRDITRRVRMEKTLAFELEVNKAVAELSALLLSQASIEDVSGVVLENAKKLTDSPFGYVGYIEANTGYLISPTLTRDIWESCEIADKSVVFEEFRGLWGWVLENKEPLLTNRPDEDPRSSGVPEGHIAIKRFASVPALLGGALVGQIALANSSRDYTERDLGVLIRLADIYAMAVLRMWSEEELDEYRQHLEELVRERTLELEEANRQLQGEIAERRKNLEELRVTAEQLRALSARVESVREEERRHLAREVHDTLGQSLTGLKINLSLLGKRLAGNPDSEGSIASMIGLVDSTIQSVREISTQLRPGVLDDLGLAAALDWQLKRFEDMTGLRCLFVCEVEDISMSKDLAVTLFRIAQEALTNIARHAGARRVDVHLSHGEDGILLEVRDDGRGIREEEAKGKGSMGILGMRERAHIYGGEIEIGSDGGAGTTLKVRMPLVAEDEGDRPAGKEDGI